MGDYLQFAAHMNGAVSKPAEIRGKQARTSLDIKEGERNLPSPTRHLLTSFMIWHGSNSLALQEQTQRSQ